MRNIVPIFSTVGIVVVAATALWWNFNLSEPTFADADDPALVARGRDVYAENCAACHGKNLKGQPNWRRRRPDGRLPAPPHDETGHTWHHSDDHLFQITKQGTASVAGPGYKTDMAPFEAVLSDAEIWAVLSYIKSRWPVAVRKRHAEINKRQR